MAGSGVIRTRRQIYNLIYKRVEGRWRPVGPNTRNTFLLWDDRYYVPSVGEARNLVTYACADLPPHSADDFDCDDFAFYARGRAGAYAARQQWSNAGICAGLFDAHCEWAEWLRHMACWVLCRTAGGEYTFLLVDPQDYKTPDPENPYPTHDVTEMNRLATILG